MGLGHITVVMVKMLVSSVQMILRSDWSVGMVVALGGQMSKPTLSRVSSYSTLSPGEVVKFKCIAPPGVCPIEFHLYKGSAGTPLVQRSQSTQSSVVLTVSNVDTSHQGSYSCLYRIPGSQPVSSPRSSSIDITIETRNASPNSATFTFPAVDFVHHGAYHCQYKTRVSDRPFSSPQSDSVSFSVIVVLLQPNISLSDPAGGMIWGHQGPEVMWGHNFTITCSTPPQYPGGIFHLTFTGSNSNETQAAVNHSASFPFPAAEFSHQGNYSCVYETTVSTRSFSSPQSELLSVMVTVVLLQPNISLSAPGGGMIWGHPESEVIWGYNFTITCSTPPQYPGGVFHLTFTGSNSNETQAAVNHSASFLFPAAEFSHQGNYSCVYETTVSTLNFSSPQSELLPLMVRGKEPTWRPVLSTITNFYEYIFQRAYR
ncbi:leukocyte immunoglobulin-like receptor subfamily A member 2 [Megalops cyprinoides]|uniref:leukocyte immunoglobulin-like receptor subfamily A member 2 n=1 Tax=Megalops cyprinoides TaxID=118141 RepID=UPI0018654BE6|nr:leukocyte immunoglobulin-like receptor subfamily A member 2 [Megalops cyprinoides]